MKAGLFACATLALSPLVAAVPSRRLKHQHHKRALETHVVYEDVQVYVHDDGIPYSTSTVTRTAETAPPGASVIQTSPTIKPSAPHTTASVPSVAPPGPASSGFPLPSSATPSHSAAPSYTAQAPSGSGPGFKNGIAYSPYRADNQCRSPDQIKLDISALKDYSVVRIYGVDCSQVTNAIAALKGSNAQIFAGVFHIDKVEAETNSLILQAKDNWSMINTVSIGNELVNSGQASVDQVAGAIGTARSLLRKAGYQGPVVTVDTMIAMKANPGLCEASDFCAINCHAFFDGHVLPEDAGKFVQGWVSDIAEKANGKKVVVTESGWPNSGLDNIDAVPSQENQEKAVASLKAAFAKDLILYSAYDNRWMTDNVKTFNAEKHWGILGQAPSNS